jgi:hypothetical protein
VRDTEQDEVRFCVDGELVATGPLDGELDMTSGRNPVLGGFGFGLDPHFSGAIDELRIMRKALPCGP